MGQTRALFWDKAVYYFALNAPFGTNPCSKESRQIRILPPFGAFYDTASSGAFPNRVLFFFFSRFILGQSRVLFLLLLNKEC